MFERFAIFYTPTGPLADFGAAWLGWDNAAGRIVPHPDIAGIDVAQITATPRQYGLHATMKAPFRLSAASGPAQLQQAVADFSARHQSVNVGHLAMGHDLGFVALRPVVAPPALQDLERAIVTELDNHRAALTEADIARRRKAPLTLRQDRQMLDWGYPYIFDDFHLHLTLSGQLPETQAALVMTALQPMVAPLIATACIIDAVTLMGQDAGGMFHQIHRYALTG